MMLSNILRLSTIATRAASTEFQAVLLNIIKSSRDPIGVLNRLRLLVQQFEPLLSLTLRDALLVTWLQAVKEYAEILPPLWEGYEIPEVSLPLLPGEPIIEFPQIQEAVKFLVRRQAVPIGVLENTAAAAQAAGFKVARVVLADTVEQLGGALASIVEHGGALRDFKAKAKEILSENGEAALTSGHLCFLPGTHVEGNVRGASKIWYDGPIAKIKTSDGRSLSVTVNHPILTPDGWKDAGNIKQGDDLVCYGPNVNSFDSLHQKSLSIDNLEFAQWFAMDNQNVPARIEDVFQSVLMERLAWHQTIRHSLSLNFYRQLPGFDSKINCVRSNRELMYGIDSFAVQLPCKRRLMKRAEASPFSSACGLYRLLYFRFLGSLLSSCGCDSPANSYGKPSFSGSSIQLRPIGLMRLGKSAHLDPSRFKAFNKTPGGDAQLYRKLVVAFPSLVSLNRVVDVEISRFRGHVYDLQTVTGFIVSEGIITSNSNIFRTNIHQAYAAGQDAAMANPLIGSEFPYVQYSAVHDSRTREQHKELEHYGIDNTAVYLRTDPTFIEFRPPWDYNCRCVAIFLTKEMAAAKGIKDAQEWLKTGKQPFPPAYVPHPPFHPPAGFVRPVGITALF